MGERSIVRNGECGLSVVLVEAEDERAPKP